MKAKLIKLSDTHYIVVDDSEIKEDDLCIYNKNHNSKNPVWELFKCGVVEREEMHPISRGKLLLWMVKVTHSTQPLIPNTKGITAANHSEYIWVSIKPLSLSEVEEAINGYNVEKMAREIVINNNPNGVENFSMATFNGLVKDISNSFKAHQELTKDKLFTVEDMYAFAKFVDRTKPSYKKQQEYIQSLLPTEWSVTFDEQGKIILL